MALIDTLVNYESSLSAPLTGSFLIAPNDSTDLTTYARGILVGTAGNVKCDFYDGSTDTVYLSAGIWHPMIVKRVYNTLTTALTIHGGK